MPPDVAAPPVFAVPPLSRLLLPRLSPPPPSALPSGCSECVWSSVLKTKHTVFRLQCGRHTHAAEYSGKGGLLRNVKGTTFFGMSDSRKGIISGAENTEYLLAHTQTHTHTHTFCLHMHICRCRCSLYIHTMYIHGCIFTHLSSSTIFFGLPCSLFGSQPLLLRLPSTYHSKQYY